MAMPLDCHVVLVPEHSDLCNRCFYCGQDHKGGSKFWYLDKPDSYFVAEVSSGIEVVRVTVRCCCVCERNVKRFSQGTERELTFA